MSIRPVSSWPRSSPGPRPAELQTGGKRRRWSGSRVIQRSRRDDEERRPRDMWRATSREKAKPTIGRSSRKLFFGLVVRECTLPDGGGLDRLSTFVRGSVPWDWSCSRRMLVRSSSRPPRWIPEARTRCVQSPMRPTTFHLGDYSAIFHVKSTWRSQFDHFTSIIFPDVWANGFGYCGHVSLFLHLRFWATVLHCAR